MLFTLIIFLSTLTIAASAHAYIGPGLGIGLLGGLLVFVITILAALIAILWYPFSLLSSRYSRKSSFNLFSGWKLPKETTRDYPLGSRIVHRTVLGNSAIGRVLYKVDCIATPKAPDIKDNRALFITGLPRSGTTFLLNNFADKDQFSSLTYRDMPFVMMPALWRKMSARFFVQENRRTRFHNDGVMLGYDSPESFEEVFWRTLCAAEYMRPNLLVPHTPSLPHQEAFMRYVSNVISRKNGGGGQRYLSKNNNNILRLSSLIEIFPNSTALVLFREPLQHAASMLRQHRHFSAQQRQDSFFSDYIAWLGHDEFGLNHRPCIMDNEWDFQQYDKNTIDYWLAYWIHVYSYIKDHHHKNTFFLSYEKLCQKNKLPNILIEHLQLEGEDFSLHARRSIHNVNCSNNDLLLRSQTLFDDLNNKAC